MKITEQMIMGEISRIKSSGYKVKKISKTALTKLRREANKSSYYIMEEGLYAWVFNRVVEW